MTRSPAARDPAGIHAAGWGWRHAGRRAAAVRGLDLDVSPGERILLLGPSGAGKSTLLHALAGVLGGDEDGDAVGILTVDGRPPETARGRVGLVLQDPDAQVVLARVGDDVAFGCENLGVPRAEIWPRVRESLDAVGLRMPLETPTSTLSGGQKQRLALAGALAMRPGLLLLDEPTANLDPEGVADVRAAVAAVLDRYRMTVIVVEHRVRVWRDLVDRVIVLDSTGGLLADGPVAETLGKHGRMLAEAGVWVPDFPRPVPSRARVGSGAALLTAENLAVGRTPFGAKAPTVVARGIDATVREGGALAVTGANGSGKTTLALTLAGLFPVADGRLRATPALARGEGETPARWKSRRLLTRIGTVFQDPEHQFLRPTVRDELAIGPRVAGLERREADRRIDGLLTRLRLDGLAHVNPFTLSGGEKRRLSVATVLAAAPQILVLDEPTFGQDARTWAELIALLAELLDAGTAVVAVTHDRDVVAAVADTELTLPAPAERSIPVAS